jgi:hypothetical protein
MPEFVVGKRVGVNINFAVAKSLLQFGRCDWKLGPGRELLTGN